MTTQPQIEPVTIAQCGPMRACTDGVAHDYRGWMEYTDVDGCGVCTAYCTKCGHRAIDDAYWE